MLTLPLAAIPNQTFSTTLNNVRFEIAIYQCNGVCCCDISINEIQIVSGARVTDGSFLMPYSAYTAGNGNFLLLTNADDLPDYTQFGQTQTLIYLTDAEIQAAVAAAPPFRLPFAAYAVA